MSSALPSPRTIGRALAVLQALPPPALAALAEQLIDRLDVLGPDADAEPDDDDEAAPYEEGNHWPPVKGPDRCQAVRIQVR